MLYAILCYNQEDVVSAWSREEDDACMAALMDVQQGFIKQGKLGPVARLVPTTAAATLRKGAGETFVIDGPFAETKEQFLGFYMVDAKDLDDALDMARALAKANPSEGAYEIRPVQLYLPDPRKT